MSRIAKWAFALPISYLIYIILGMLLPSVNTLTSALRYALLTICVLIVSKYFLKFDIKNFFSENRKFDFAKLFKGFAVMTVITFTTSAVWFFIERESFVFTFKGFESVKEWFIQLPLLITAVICEELIYRSYIAHFLKNEFETNSKKALLYSLASAVFFTIAHFENPEVSGEKAIWAMLFYFIFGFALMLITLRTKGLETSIGIHFANNLFCTVMLSYENAVIQSSAIFTHYSSIGPILLVQTVICLTVCAFIC